MLKFDTVVMNPPYQSSQVIKNANGKRGRGDKHLLWPKFITKALEISKDSGYICAIHPSKWRKPTDPMWKIMRQNQIDYLEIHNASDGKRTFGCSTRYDWYVIQKTPPYKNTIVKDQNGCEDVVNTKELSILPNAKIKEINELIAKNDEERVNILYSCSYHHTYPYMSREKTSEHIYPCIYSISVKGEPNCYYSNTNKKGHFGIPKIIFASGGVKSIGFIIDEKGEYGMTEFAKGIVDDPSIMPLIKEAMSSQKFRELAECFSMSANELDKDVLGLFRKNFWEKFK